MTMAVSTWFNYGVGAAVVGGVGGVSGLSGNASVFSGSTVMLASGGTGVGGVFHGCAFSSFGGRPGVEVTLVHAGLWTISACQFQGSNVGTGVHLSRPSNVVIGCSFQTLDIGILVDYSGDGLNVLSGNVGVNCGTAGIRLDAGTAKNIIVGYSGNTAPISDAGVGNTQTAVITI